MRLLIIRHGEPDYSIDSLTEKGWREADLLSKRLVKMEIDEFYQSPLGRAQHTALATLKLYGKDAITKDWLQEFPARIHRPDRKDKKMIPWDWLPADWTSEPRFFDREAWKQVECMQEAGVGEMYDRVCSSFDELLAEHGYTRAGNLYRAAEPNDKTIALFCHFGLECVLLSHLMNISPMLLWHGMVASPSSVTSVYTEERREGFAYFRANYIGDISHLYVADEEPSFAARFCEMYVKDEERHD